MNQPTALPVPKRYQEAMRTLQALPQAVVDSLIASLRAVAPAMDVERLLVDVQPKVTPAMDESKTRTILEMLTSLYVARASRELGLDEFVSAVCRGAAQTGVANASDTSQLSARLKALLSLDESLGITSRALGVRLEQERVFIDARIITDVRPVFGSSPSEQPRYATLVHNLRITYRSAEEEVCHFIVALDRADLAVLHRLLERAQSKEHSLLAACAQAGITCLEASDE